MERDRPRNACGASSNHSKICTIYEKRRFSVFFAETASTVLWELCTPRDVWELAARAAGNYGAYSRGTSQVEAELPQYGQFFRPIRRMLLFPRLCGRRLCVWVGL